jgi:hypothetical protein
MASIARLKRSVWLLIASSMGVLMLPRSLYARTWMFRAALAAIRQTMHQPGMAVEIEDYRFISREKRFKILLTQAMRMFSIGLQLEQVDNIDEPDSSGPGIPRVGAPLRPRVYEPIALVCSCS